MRPLLSTPASTDFLSNGFFAVLGVAALATIGSGVVAGLGLAADPVVARLVDATTLFLS